MNIFFWQRRNITTEEEGRAAEWLKQNLVVEHSRPVTVTPQRLAMYRHEVEAARQAYLASRRHAFLMKAVGAGSAAALVAGLTGTSFAAAMALPGSALYGLKVGAENAALALAPNSSIRAQIAVYLAKQRLSELRQISSKNRPLYIKGVLQDIKTYLPDAKSAPPKVIKELEDETQQLEKQSENGRPEYTTPSEKEQSSSGVERKSQTMPTSPGEQARPSTGEGGSSEQLSPPSDHSNSHPESPQQNHGDQDTSSSDH